MEYILKGLYWEELWELVLVSANSMVYEKNQEQYFQFILHGGKPKDWKDSPLPFPKERAVGRKPHYGGLDQLPKHIPVKRVNLKNNGNRNRHSNTSS